MDVKQIKVNREVRSDLLDHKYSFIQANQFSISPELQSARHNFWMDWDYLEPDKYLKNNGRFRLRCFNYMYFFRDGFWIQLTIRKIKLKLEKN